MISGDPITSLHESLAQARYLHLKPIRQEIIRRRALTKKEQEASGSDRRVVEEKTGEWRELRPNDHEVEVTMFTQVWGSTALGFGGIGGAAMTTAYTVVVQGPNGDCAVYFNGRLAYHVEDPSPRFYEDLANRSMVRVASSSAYHKTAK